MNHIARIKDFEGFNQATSHIMEKEGYRKPQAFAVGFMYCGADGGPVAVYFPCVNMNENDRTAAIFQEVTGWNGSDTVKRGESIMAHTDQAKLDLLLKAYEPFEGDGKPHPNIDALKMVRKMTGRTRFGGGKYEPVFVFIYDLDLPPTHLPELYLRLYLLSTRKARPNTLNLDGTFEMLPNCTWTRECGPIKAEDFDRVNMLHIMEHGEPLHVDSVDKFPRMCDFIVPSGIRIADANNVRLGAHLAPGTMVMHAGSINFNAGTLGKAMVEGRISAGVVVGADSAIGGGASTMGTLSGGGKERVSIGERCLIGANGGTGISLGNDCKIEAGLYVKVEMRVRKPNGEVVKAMELSGQNSMTFYRGESGMVEVRPTKSATQLNPVLHG